MRDATVPGPVPASLKTRCERFREELSPFLTQKLGETATHLDSHLALVGDCSVVALIAAATRDHVQTALTGTLFAALPLLCMASALKAGGQGGPDHYVAIPPGPITEADLARIYPFPNRLQLRLASGARIREWLEHAAGLFNRIEPGQTGQELLSQDFPPGNFDVILGLTYQFDLSAPARYTPLGQMANPLANRVRNLCHGGVPLRDDDQFLVAMNGFRANGGGFYPGLGGGQIHQILPTTPDIPDVLRQFLRKGRWAGRPCRPWSFVPMAGTSAIFETGPAVLTRPLPPDLASLGLQSNGFLRLEMSLDAEGLARLAVND